ncbi:MAG TPA: TIGR03621 family F420-dependent LLM class oxidoreductase [Acidimicrobiales bacterium]
MRPFRFGFQFMSADAAEVARSARAAEAAGFDVFQVADHVGAQPTPLVALGAAAAATSTIGLGTLVLNNDLHHPVVLAQEVATLDQLSGGRVELGLGAGHSFTEYAAMGLPFDPPGVRKARLAESVEIVRALLDGQVVRHEGTHYSVVDARTLRPTQAHVPLLVGVNGRAALAHAARHADTVGLTMLGRTKEDGQHHEVRWEADRLDATVDWIRGAVGTTEVPELHALVQLILETDDRRAAAEELEAELHTRPADILSTPFLCLGTHEEMARHLLACRERWGISYFSVRDVDAFAPVMQLVRRLDDGTADNS